MPQPSTNRRDFIKASTAAGAALATLSLAPAVHAAGSDVLKVGLVGCGGRGTGAAAQAVAAAEGVRVVALGDVFRAKVDAAREALAQSDVAARARVADADCFDGLDAYRHVIRHPEVDVVIHATPPAFRPQHLAEAVAAGKHSFVEKPVCVDPVGYRKILECARIAKERKLAIVAGTQFRRSNNYVEVIDAIHRGAIGDILFAQARYCASGIWYRPREAGMSDAAYQIHNWYHFLWLCGDQIVEQAVHNIDAMNWVMGGPPSKAFGSGGQRARPADSEIYDCMSIDYEYPNGATVSFECRQQAGKSEVSNRVVGTKGTAWIMPFGRSTITTHGGETVLRVDYQPDSYVQEHADLLASILRAEPLHEAETVADSSLTAIMGRMAAYTGEEVTWQFVKEESKLDLMPENLSLDAKLPARGIAVPGKCRLT